MMQQELVSDLYRCYAKLLEGRTPSELAGEYVRIEALAAQKLFEKHVSLAELLGFQERRTERIRLAPSHVPIGCNCGLMCVSLRELSLHVSNFSDRGRHGVKAWKRPR